MIVNREKETHITNKALYKKKERRYLTRKQSCLKNFRLIINLICKKNYI